MTDAETERYRGALGATLNLPIRYLPGDSIEEIDANLDDLYRVIAKHRAKRYYYTNEGES